MRFTHKILLMPLVAAAAFIILLGISWYQGKRNTELTDQIELRYFPAVRLSNSLEKLAVRIRHSYQNAITLQDADMVTEADDLVREFRLSLNEAGFLPPIAAEHIEELRRTFDAYVGLARPVTLQMIESELTDDLLAQAAEMNGTYEDLMKQLQSAGERIQGEIESAFERARRSRDVWQHAMFFAVIVGLGLIIFVSIGAISTTLRPLRRITAATEGIALGNLDSPLTYESGDELGRLAESFRRMQAHLIADIAQRERAEAALRESEERYRGIFENATSGIVRTTPDGRVQNANPAMVKMMGYSSVEEIRSQITDIASQVYVSKGERDQVLMDLQEHGQSLQEMKFKRRNSSKFDVEMSLWCEKDETGKITAIEGIVTDISDRKAAETALKRALSELELTNEDLKNTNNELRETQAQLVQSEKMASLGRFVAGIAHEFNNPVAAVQSSSMNIATGLTKLEAIVEAERPGVVPPEVDKILRVLHDGQRVIVEGSNRVAEIVRRMKNFVRLDEASLQRANIHTCLEDTLAIFDSELKAGVEVKKEFGDLPEVLCYPARLNQLFLQLLSNANRAIDHKEGAITISTRKLGEQIEIKIRDTGVGIAANKLSRIFDPGYTTWGVGVGVGLGLTIAYQIVQDHSGTIEAESEVGQGSCFTVRLPVSVLHSKRQAANA